MLVTRQIQVANTSQLSRSFYQSRGHKEGALRPVRPPVLVMIQRSRQHSSQDQGLRRAQRLAVLLSASSPRRSAFSLCPLTKSLAPRRIIRRIDNCPIRFFIGECYFCVIFRTSHRSRSCSGDFWAKQVQSSLAAAKHYLRASLQGDNTVGDKALIDTIKIIEDSLNTFFAREIAATGLGRPEAGVWSSSILDAIASISWDLRIRPAPGIPRSSAIRCSSGMGIEGRPLPDGRRFPGSPVGEPGIKSGGPSVMYHLPSGPSASRQPVPPFSRAHPMFAQDRKVRKPCCPEPLSSW